MALVNNAFPRGRMIGVFTDTLAASVALGHHVDIQIATGNGMSQRASTPLGYPVTRAYLYAIKAGGIGARIAGLGMASGALSGVGNLDAALTGIGMAGGEINAGVFIGAALTGAGAVTTAPLDGPAFLRATISIGATPSATDIAQAVWGGVALEGTLGGRDLLRILLAVAAGKTDIVPLGGGAATVSFRDQADTKDRVAATMAGSERTSVTVDPS